MSLYDTWANTILQFQSTLNPYREQAPNGVDESTS